MKKQPLILCLIILLNTLAAAQNGRIKVTADGHYLQYENGKPFFWLGDTGWELFHRLTKEEIERYLENRRKKGFNLIQAVILAEFDGLTRPNRYNELPLMDKDPTKPNDKYFELVDWTVKNAQKKGIFMGLLPTWGDKVTKLWGTGPVIFNESNAYIYGVYLGKRYATYPNIVWILGGDRPAANDSVDWRPIWRSMAKGIKEGTGDKAIFSYHTWGGSKSTSQDMPNEAWLDINMMQSGHGGGHDVNVWDNIARDYSVSPAKPTLDSEPNYEDHPVNPWPKWDPATGYYRDYDVRKQTYRSVFSGGCGVTYGHHAVWQFYSPREEIINFADRFWTEAIDRKGAFQVGYLRKLIESRDPLSRIPDQTLILDKPTEKSAYMTALRDKNGRFAMIYLPIGQKILVNTTSLKGKSLKAGWFNPRTGKFEKSWTLLRVDAMAFAPPELSIEKDWVLVLDALK